MDFFAAWGLWLARIVVLTVLFCIFAFAREKLGNVGTFVIGFILFILICSVNASSAVPFAIVFLLMWGFVAMISA